MAEVGAIATGWPDVAFAEFLIACRRCSSSLGRS
jgi:hypothetical protein